MTTNKPEVFEVYRTRQGTLDDVVLLSDYEALQAECEKWKRGSEIRDEQNRDLHSFIMELKAECEKLRNLLVEIERGCSRRDMPSEQTISSWADAIDAATQRDALCKAADANDAERELEALRRDAELYRALRAMHWYDSPLAVVQSPKEAVKPGTYCPSGNQLDEILEEYMSETQNPGEA